MYDFNVEMMAPAMRDGSMYRKTTSFTPLSSGLVSFETKKGPEKLSSGTLSQEEAKRMINDLLINNWVKLSK